MTWLDELETLEQAGTPAPWLPGDAKDLHSNHKADVALIVALRNSAPALLWVVRAAGQMFAVEERAERSPWDDSRASSGDLVEARRNLLDALEALDGGDPR